MLDFRVERVAGLSTDHQWRAEGLGEWGAGPGDLMPGGHPKSENQRLKCCNWMVFPIVSLLIQAG